MDEIRSFVTNIGQVIGKVITETDFSIELDDAIQIVLQQKTETEFNMGFQPILPDLLAQTNKKHGIWLNLSKIGLIEFKLTDQVLEAYNKIMSNIQIATAATLVDLNSRRK